MNLGVTLAFIKWMTSTEGRTILARNSMIPAGAAVLSDPDLAGGQPS
ncbi:hypothetical protein J7E88_09145 [Streptomyces sp. ISL-10]|nr:hypothetical protein [Streptomyces sp. ISL-10]